MRDGPFHHTTVLAGLWGGDNYANFSRAREVRARLLGVEVVLQKVPSEGS